MKLFRKLTNKGLTLVELICALAILGLVGLVIGSMIIVSSESYDKGITEVELQQEAQTVVNQISDLVIDSSTDPATGLSVHYDGTANTLNIPEMTETGDIRTHKITHRDNKLYYSYSIGGTNSGEELMAEGITKFEPDTSTFAESGNLYLDVAVERESRGTTREFEATFHITSRNGVVETVPVAVIDVEDCIVLEPGQSFTFHPSVSGISEDGVVLRYVGGATSASTTVSGNSITIGRNETGSVIQLLAQTTALDGNNVPMAQRNITVRIRRITSINISYELTTAPSTALKNGAQYKFTAELEGTYLEKQLDVSNDDDYVSPYEIRFTYSADGINPWPTFVGWGQVPNSPVKNGMLYLHQDMAPLSYITVTAYARHAYDGINKTGTAYDHNMLATAKIDGPSFDTYTLNRGLRRGMETPAYGEFTGYDRLKGLLPNGGSYQPEKVYRFRKVGETNWSPWYGGWGTRWFDQGNSINLRCGSTWMLDYASDYEIQIRLQIIDTNHIVNGEYSKYEIVWPEADTPQSAYLIDEVMQKATIIFKGNGFSNSTGRDLGHLTENNYDNLFEYEDCVGLEMKDLKNNIRYTVQKEDSSAPGGWRDVGELQRGSTCRGNNMNNFGNGNFRIEVWVDNCPMYSDPDTKAYDFNYHPGQYFYFSR